MISVEVEIRGADAALRTLGHLPDEVAWAVDRKLARAAAQAARAMKGKAPQDTVTLVNSIRSEQVAPLVHRAVAGVQHARYMESGTGPGGRPPITAMERWVVRKGLTPRNPTLRGVRDLAWAIARSITRRGVRAQPFARPVAADPAFQARVQALVDQGVADGLRQAGV